MGTQKRDCAIYHKRKQDKNGQESSHGAPVSNYTLKLVVWAVLDVLTEAAICALLLVRPV